MPVVSYHVGFLSGLLTPFATLRSLLEAGGFTSKTLIAGYTLVVGGGVLAGAAFFTGSVLAACGSLSPTLDPLTQAPIPASN